MKNVHRYSHRGNSGRGSARSAASRFQKEDKSTAPMHAALGLYRNSIIINESARKKDSAQCAESPSLQTGQSIVLTLAVVLL